MRKMSAKGMADKRRGIKDNRKNVVAPSPCNFGQEQADEEGRYPLCGTIVVRKRDVTRGYYHQVEHVILL